VKRSLTRPTNRISFALFGFLPNTFVEKIKGSISMTSRMTKPLGTRARTGEVCPESGVWQPEGFAGHTAPIAKGNRMPPYRDHAVTWILIQYA